MCVCPKYAVIRTKEDGKKYFKWIDDALIDSVRDEVITIPCGKCPDCLQQYSMQWAYRIMNECEYHRNSIFLTLTYGYTFDDELHPRDLQLFIKRLRKKLGDNKIRYFACGEYGSKGHRPHYHMILFGYVPEDITFFKFTSKHEKIYTSKILSDLWQHGYISIGYVEQKTAKYCAKYMQKLNELEDKKVKPFIRSSTHPGIGYQYCIDHIDDILASDKIYYEGKYISTPRYYLKIINEQLGLDITVLKDKRKLKKDLIFSDGRIQEKLDKYKRFLNWDLTKLKKSVILKAKE